MATEPPAQRLVRRLCSHCKEEYQVTDEELRELGVDPSSIADRKAYRKGTTDCPHCQNTHYSGRSGIHELLLINDEIRSLILQRVDSSTIKNAAMRCGFDQVLPLSSL